MSEAEAFKSLGAFPVLQAAIAILILLAGIWLVFRGGKDRKQNEDSGIPQWLPIHDAIGAIHAIAEQSREMIRLLGRIENLSGDIAKEQREQTMLLEDIRNNQVQRSDITVAGVRRKPI